MKPATKSKKRSKGPEKGSKSGLTYAESGVDIEAGDAVVDLIKPALRRTHTSRVMGQHGAFAGMFRLDYNEALFKKNYRDPVLVACTDGDTDTDVHVHTDDTDSTARYALSSIVITDSGRTLYVQVVDALGGSFDNATALEVAGNAILEVQDGFGDPIIMYTVSEKARQRVSIPAETPEL